MNYWLLKTEPTSFSIDDLEKIGTEHWDGVRNYQARNFMKNEMRIGDFAFIYHSNCKQIGITGVAEIVKESYPDHTQFDPNSKYYDIKSNKKSPRWFMVDVRFLYKYRITITMEKLKQYPELVDMKLLQKGNRLSVLPVSEQEFKFIDLLGDKI